MAYREEAGGFGRDTCHVGLVEDLSQLDAFRAADCLHPADVHVEALWRRVAAPNLVVLKRDGSVPVGGEYLTRCSLNQTGKTAYTGAHACAHTSLVATNASSVDSTSVPSTSHKTPDSRVE